MKTKLIFGLIFVFLLSLAVAQAEIYCEDSDGGENIYEYGTATNVNTDPDGMSEMYSDFCLTDTILFEGICESNSATQIEITCPVETPYCNAGICSITPPSSGGPPSGAPGGGGGSYSPEPVVCVTPSCPGNHELSQTGVDEDGCPTYECVDIEIACHSNADCPTSETTYYCDEGGHACSETPTQTCENPGTGESVCVEGISEVTCTAEPCSYGCQEGICIDNPLQGELLYFYQEGCSYSENQNPIIDEIEGYFPNINVSRLNIELETELAEEYDIIGTPTIIFINPGGCRQTKLGLTDENTLKEWIVESSETVCEEDNLSGYVCPTYSSGIVVHEKEFTKQYGDSDDTYENGWQFSFFITVPEDEDMISLWVDDWVNDETGSILPTEGNVELVYEDRNYSVGSEHNYFASESFITADMYPACAGRQIEFDVLVKLPEETEYGHYTTSYGIQSLPNDEISLAEAEIVVLDFVNDNFLDPEQPAELINSQVDDASGLYKVNLSIWGDPTETYLTRDGKLFLPEGVETDASIISGEDRLLQAEAIVQDFISLYYDTIEIVDSVEERFVYKISLVMTNYLGYEQQIESYLTKNGEIFFPAGYLVEEYEPPVCEEPPVCSEDEELQIIGYDSEGCEVYECYSFESGSGSGSVTVSCSSTNCPEGQEQLLVGYDENGCPIYECVIEEVFEE